jgi:hypothetical protein
MQNRLIIQNVGQIKKADIEFGDLTVFVGPQATGKSIALQLLKLIVDKGHVLAELKRYGLDWDGDVSQFLDIYLGEGMKSVWHESSKLSFNNRSVDLPVLIKKQKKRKEEILFFIPAQRVLALRDGWPRPFTDYNPGDPFAVREFSEKLRTLMEQEFREGINLFPQERRLKVEFRKLVADAFFSTFKLNVDKHRSQKRLVLGIGENGNSLPYMVWSAGQREFVPLLLGFYWLMPPAKTPRRQGLEWVVIEELEMGLHPKAISVVILMILELIQRGYKVCLSTHSPHVLDVMWALRRLKEENASPELLLEVFESSKTPPMKSLANKVFEKQSKVYYFDREGQSHDISDLDPGSDKSVESGWGGLSEFSGRVADIVAKAVRGE